MYGQDLRANSNCPDGFKLKRSDLTSEKYKEYGFVIEGSDGKPLGGDATVGCFSNCGKYKFPVEPAQNCDTSDPTCYRWKVFCAGDPTQYGASCSTDNDCPVLASCWNNPGSTQNQKCSLRGFIAKPPCPDDVCTFPYGYLNPASGLPDYSTQPPFGLCSEVDPNNPGEACIGDDTVHEVFPHAYTWPNDPQVYADDAPLYRVVFSPGGTSVPITPSVASLPQCSALTSNIYQPDQARTLCSIDIQNGAVFGIARPSPNAWSCNLGDGAGNDGVICRWNSQLATVKPSFDGTPGKRSCRTRSHATLTRHFGSLRVAARMHGYANKKQLTKAVKAFCRG
ncbi:hypothetical protein [Methyloterricola oryzae]|uniref:hypothetical protein n=1 Tax=Methyloterricola oryzae TaxID=1495050 RepID=UPI0005EBC0EE|nr:hypothetical protein [Methyloterricola oryzae]